MTTATPHIQTITFASCGGHGRIRGVVWWPQHPCSAKGIVQIVHGMSEHIQRYEPFATYLTEQGWVVAGHDAIGHGASVTHNSELGHIPYEARAEALLGDIHRMRDAVDDLVAECCAVFGKHREKPVPHVLFGHSMGSYAVRAYLGRNGHGLAGTIICGTGSVPEFQSLFGQVVVRLLMQLRGQTYRSAFVKRLGLGAYARQIPGPTGLEWLSHNEANVQAYCADPLCGASFSLGGYAALLDLTAEACSTSCMRATPHRLPMLFIAGDEDPVGACGAGVTKAAEGLRAQGHRQVNVILYKGMRHEILNEVEATKVFADVASWLDTTAASAYTPERKRS